jgi:two-component system NarL family sensor kinase
LRWYSELFPHPGQSKLIPATKRTQRIDAKLEMSADWERLPEDYELCLFRIAQVLTNVHRHSGSLTARVRLLRSPGEVKLEVLDEGRVISGQTLSSIAAGATSGAGLRGMRERIRQFGGSMEVRSAGKGTAVIATVPFVGIAG